MLKDFKYWAGLFDADGSFDLNPKKRLSGEYHLDIRATLYQKETSVLYEFARLYDVEVNEGKGAYYVTLHGTKAEMFMREILKHLVIKHGVVEYILSLKGLKTEDIKAVRKSVKAMRSVHQDKVFPSRKWMAGYIDGDGCILSSYRKSDGVLEFKLSVVSHTTQRAGLDLMKKQFGGIIVEQNDVRRWNITLSISKGKQVLGYFAKHLKIKKEQASLVLECLNSKKHLRREGATKESNYQLHRRLQLLKSAASTK